MKWKNLPFLIIVFAFLPQIGFSQHSVARQWNEILLDAIRNDFARPTVHARNLFHTSAAMYDLWAVFDNKAETFFLGKTVSGFTIPFEGMPTPENVQAARDEAISFAMYRLLNYRFRVSPGIAETLPLLINKMSELGYDLSFTSTDYTTGNAAALGNYLAEKIIEFGQQDYSNDQNDYANIYYYPFNFSLNPTISGPGFLYDMNRWQPLTFEVFVDQAGNPIPGNALEFLSPEWGKVTPFALQEEDLVIYERDPGFDEEYWVYHDPGPPSYIDNMGGLQTTEYQWGFSLVSIWSSHLDHTDGVMIDISPASIGNIESYPTTLVGLRDFFNYLDGGDPSQGHAVNPATGMPYEPQIVPRADYARVLAEFWADGPDSETPPGHWYTILNYVNDHPLFEKRFKGEGEILDDMEWDVKAYFILGGAVHDAAVTAWGIKGWYDYVRPISAIRGMADMGQCTDTVANNFSFSGIPLVEGYIEVVQAGDPLAGNNNEHVGKIKVFAWKGPDYIQNEETDVAGVDWILAENWWPYQRPSFVTPPFAGYISGHSTFSRAAAEVMTMLTGDAFFPGGVGEFVAKQNEFLVFEDGPSVDVILQWATYRDASDQTSLSRIWGGIHPPVDDIPGRLIGAEIGVDAFVLGEQYFNGLSTSLKDIDNSKGLSLTPNPVKIGEAIQLTSSQYDGPVLVEIFDVFGKKIREEKLQRLSKEESTEIESDGLSHGMYVVSLTGNNLQFSQKIIVH